MPISTTCPSCKAIFRLPEELAGKKVKCQKCESIFIVPSGADDTLAPGARVASSEPTKKTALTTPSSKVKPAPTRSDDVPVSAPAADDADPDEDEGRPERSRPRRGERRPRRDEEPQRKSALLPVLLALCGLGLLSCIGAGAVVAVWFLAAEPQQQAVVMKQKGFRPGFKNGPGDFNGPGGRLPNLTPTTELKLGPDGIVRVNTELTLQDELNPDFQRHKHYAIELEAGKRYQIDMKVPKNVVLNNRQMKQFDAYLILLDDANKIVAENDDLVPPGGPIPHNQDSQIIYTAPRTGVYKIEATFCNNGDGLELGEFILTVKRLPD